jgi:glycogen operon protein
MTEQEWSQSWTRVVGMALNGQLMDEYNDRGEKIKDDMLLLLLNAHWEDVPFTLPGKEDEPDWDLLMDTANACGDGERRPSYPGGDVYNLQARSLVLLVQKK